MTRIDPIKLVGIFRTLDAKNKSGSLQSSATEKTLDAVHTNSRDERELRSRLIKRLQQLKEKSEDYYTNAPYVTVQEVMAWEFGDEIVNNPDFSGISRSIVHTIHDTPEIRIEFDRFLKDLMENTD